MRPGERTREKLLEDLELLRQRNDELERAESERKRTEEALAHRNEELTVLFTVANILVEPGTFEDKVARVMEELLRICQGDRAVFMVRDDEVEGLKVISQAGQVSAGPPTTWVSYESVSGDAFRQGEPIVVNDYGEHAHAVATGVSRGIGSAIALPVKNSEGTMGVLDLISGEPNHFTPERVKALLVVGDGLGMLMANARLYELLQQHADELARSNAELEQFAYVASHDLQEPLRSIVGFTGFLSRRYGGQLGEHADRYISRIVNASMRMQTQIEDLLTYSRVGRHVEDLVPTDCDTIVAQEIGNLRAAIQEAGAAVTHEPLPTVMAHSSLVSQLLRNLIGNAIKFRRDGLAHVHVSAQQTNREWVFSVKDDGIGIELQFADRIFSIFQRLHTRDEYPGTGIGLAVCKKAVDRLGGRIWVDSDPGGGSIFYFTVPIPGSVETAIEYSPSDKRLGPSAGGYQR